MRIYTRTFLSLSYLSKWRSDERRKANFLVSPTTCAALIRRHSKTFFRSVYLSRVGEEVAQTYKEGEEEGPRERRNWREQASAEDAGEYQKRKREKKSRERKRKGKTEEEKDRPALFHFP